MIKSFKVIIYFIINSLIKLLISLFITGIFFLIFYLLTLYYKFEINIVSAIIGGMFSFVLSYYLFNKSNMIKFVKEKKRKIYIPIIKELYLNRHSIISNIIINPNTIYIKTIDKILLNEDNYLLSNHIRSWLNEYLNLYSQYSRLFENKYKVFISFLNHIKKEYSINIDEMHYSVDFFVKCLISIYRQDEEIIGDINFTNNDKEKKDVKIKNIIFNLCNEEIYKKDLLQSNEKLIFSINELISVFNIMINIININYLNMIDYI